MTSPKCKVSYLKERTISISDIVNLNWHTMQKGVLRRSNEENLSSEYLMRTYFSNAELPYSPEEMLQKLLNKNWILRVRHKEMNVLSVVIDNSNSQLSISLETEGKSFTHCLQRILQLYQATIATNDYLKQEKEIEAIEETSKRSGITHRKFKHLNPILQGNREYEGRVDRLLINQDFHIRIAQSGVDFSPYIISLKSKKAGKRFCIRFKKLAQEK